MEVKAAILMGNVLDSLILVIYTWLLASLSTYAVKRRQKLKGSDSEKIFIACFTSIIAAVPGRFVELVILNASSIPGALKSCEYLQDTIDFFIGVSYYSVYLALWLRLHFIYGNTAIGALVGKHVKRLSIAVIIATTIVTVTMVVGVVIPETYSGDNVTCILKNLSDIPADVAAFVSVRRYVLGTLFFLFQFVLLGLFLYPMIALRRRSGLQKANDKDDSVSWLIKRSSICMAVSVLSDVILIVLMPSLTMEPKYVPTLGDIYFGLTIAINNICTLATFRDFKGMILASVKQESELPDENTVNSAITVTSE